MKPIDDLHLLVIAPHPDDAELFCGGLILSMANRGYRVGVVDLSLAELSTFGNIEQRRKETDNASRILGLSWRTNLELANCRFHEHARIDAREFGTNPAVELLTTVIRSTRPEIVVAPYMYDRHPDHVQGGKLAVRSLFMAGLKNYQEPHLPEFSPRQLLFYQFRTEFNPSFIVDISDFIEKKYEAIGCYSSQLKPPSGSSASTLLSSSNSMSALRARDAHLGAYIGVPFGEGYLSRTIVRIDDVVQHSRSNPTAGALFFKEHLS